MTYYGFNGTNTAEVLTTEVINLLVDMIPEGESLVYRLRNDKYEGAMPADHVTNVLNLHNTLEGANRSLKIIYTFDTRNQVSLEQNFYGFNILRGAGCDIIAAEMGNEEWAEVAGHGGNWGVFQSKFTPVLEELNNIGFTGKRIFPITQNNPRFNEWDDAGIDFINLNILYEPVLHLYYNHIDAPILDTLNRDELPSSVYNKNTYLADKDNFFYTLAEQILNSDLFERNINFVIDRMPGKKIWFTEYGPAVNTGNLQNTLGFHLTDFYILNLSYLYQDIIAVMCKHNGPTTPLTGIISKKNKLDVLDGDYIPRLSYYTMKMFMNYKDSGMLPFYMLSSSSEELTGGNNMVYIHGDNWYSSCGKCEWWGDGSVGDYLISGISENPSATALPAYSFGFYEPVFVDVYGCTDPNANNYNPDATIDDGSCTYNIYGCTDSNALNYDPDANIDDGSCTYKPKSNSRWYNKFLKWLGITA